MEHFMLVVIFHLITFPTPVQQRTKLVEILGKILVPSAMVKFMTLLLKINIFLLVEILPQSEKQIAQQTKQVSHLQHGI